MRFLLGVSTSESCKDVDVVSVLPDCSNSMTTTMESLDSEIDRRFKERALANSRIRSQDDGSICYDSGQDSVSVSSVGGFEFQKAERAPHRVPFASFSKPAPSKWDDAGKWIASPVSNRPKAGQSQVQGGQAFVPRKTGVVGFGNRQPATKVVVEVPEQKAVAVEEVDTKRIDPSHGKMEVSAQKIVNWAPEPYPVADLFVKPEVIVESSIADSAGKGVRHSFELILLSSNYTIHFLKTILSWLTDCTIYLLLLFCIKLLSFFPFLLMGNFHHVQLSIVRMMIVIGHC